jgi:hypothetical protein
VWYKQSFPYQGKTPSNYENTLKKNEGQEGKTGPFQRWVPVVEERPKGKGEGWQIWWVYFVFL